MGKMSNFKRGFCRALDLCGTSKPILNIAKRDTDLNVLTGDWENVGRDIRTAVGRYDFRENR